MVSDGQGLYLHLPWCVRKCPYCDFNSFEARGTLAEQAYVTALLADLDAELRERPRPRVASVFIGGGTPSLFSAEAIARLLDGCAARTDFTPDVEITLEANPGTAEAARLRGYLAAGVNRLSLGIQSFDDAMLARLGRIHGAEEARRAVTMAREAGCANLNLDLMFGLPEARPGDALRDLEQAIALAPEHLSWYQLTLEEGTAFGRRPPPLPEHDLICDDYDAGLALLAAAGYTQYEISAYAREGRAARHNLNYWHFGDYLGIGAGAHGKRTDAEGRVWRTTRIRHPERYMRAALAGDAVDERSQVRGVELATEFMLNALRLAEGFPLALFEQRTGLAREVIAAPLAEALARGWLLQRADWLQPTSAGFLFLNDLQLLFTGLDDSAVAA
ncbi:MAG: radical SAM family heme chaperone HemW [Gammaproteobacteria bacterium]|nr:radical SAM family heme chaperone HemW [Gammaproteobacteria bacterium]